MGSPCCGPIPARQALHRARTAQPDLVILDAQMPDMHGTEVCRDAARGSPRFSPAVPIIITTAGPSGRAGGGSRPIGRGPGNSWVSPSMARRCCSSSRPSSSRSRRSTAFSTKTCWNNYNRPLQHAGTVPPGPGNRLRGLSQAPFAGLRGVLTRCRSGGRRRAGGAQELSRRGNSRTGRRGRAGELAGSQTQRAGWARPNLPSSRPPPRPRAPSGWSSGWGPRWTLLLLPGSSLTAFSLPARPPGRVLCRAGLFAIRDRRHRDAAPCHDCPSNYVRGPTPRSARSEPSSRSRSGSESTELHSESKSAPESTGDCPPPRCIRRHIRSTGRLPPSP